MHALYIYMHTYFFCYFYYIYNTIYIYNRRKFRSQTSDNMDRWKAEQGRGREKRKIRREKSRRERVRRKKMQMREKVGKSRNTVLFQWFEAPEGRKVGLLKRQVRSQLARWEMKNCTPLWREAHFEVKMYKTHQPRSTFGSWDVEKVHAIVARSTFPSQNVQNTPASEHFWKLRCRKSARRCGAKHISKSKCTKHTSSGPLLEVEMSKKCTPLWREAHFQVKLYKTYQLRTTFGSWDVEKVHAAAARSTFPSHNVKKTRGSDHFWTFRSRFAWRRKGLCTLSKVSKTWGFCSVFNYNHHYITLHPNTLHYTTTTTTTTPSLHSTTPHSTTLHCTQLHSISLHYITLHYTTLHYTTLHYTTLLPLHFTTLHYTNTPQHYNYKHSTTLHYTPLHSTTLNYTTLHYITLHYTPLHYTTLHYTTLHYLPLHFTTLHYTTLHYTTATTATTLHYTPLR